MQETQGSTKLHDSLMQSTDMYKKMFNMGLCAIDKGSDSGTFKIMLESPEVPLAKFIASVNEIWPGIEIQYFKKDFPYEILVTRDRSNGGLEYSKDLTVPSVLKFTYNPDLVNSTSDFVDRVLSEWFSLVQKKYLLVTRKHNFDDANLPERWPHDMSFHRIARSIKRIAGEIFLKMDWENFNQNPEDFGALLIQKDPEYSTYFSKELLESISDKYISIRTLLNEKSQREKNTQGMESNNLQKREVQI